MSISFHKKFKKSFNKLLVKQQKAFFERLRVFSVDPYNPLLNNHALGGKYQGCRSINVSGDVRAVYVLYQYHNDTVVFIDIGTHAQLYD